MCFIAVRRLQTPDMGNISGCVFLSQPPLAMVFTNQRDIYCDALILSGSL